MIYTNKKSNIFGHIQINHIVNIGVLYIIWEYRNDGWMRLFGTWWGIHWTHNKNDMIFSERYGYRKFIILFNYRFKILKPAKNYK